MTLTANAVPFQSASDVLHALPRIAAHLRAHHILAHPTETLYGFGSSVAPDAVDALIAFKGRSENKPFLLLVSGPGMLNMLRLRVTPDAERLAAAFWPGPLTLIMPTEINMHRALRGPSGGIAVRWTAHPGMQRAIETYGAPITSTSANRPGLPPARSAQEIVTEWRAPAATGDLMVLDGGELAVTRGSTVVDCTEETTRIVRAGILGAGTLRSAVPDLVGDE
ncbi:MAG TPA: L-threonylcarbamoyladenylate synthase [Gemmatimonadaceae bacterium]|nr:L-threonylcarbamoyladenylate synthase [Gemmatimonadaceae bacterium]